MTAPMPPGPPPGPYAGYAVPPPAENRDRRTIIILISVLVVLLIGAVTAVVVLSGNNKAAASDVSLESNLQPGPDPYSPSVVATPPAPTTPSTTAATPTTAPAPTTTIPPYSVPPASSTGIRSYVGGQPGLYGGTRNYHSCDPERMITYLYENPAKLAAWADVEGISTTQVRSYITSLTSVLLRTDTWVTNHGYANGHATTRSAVLQAGTAVMVDTYGVPRAKCYCGNPLTPITRYYTPHYTGTPWYGWNPSTVVVIQQNITVINKITIIDIYTGRPFDRPTGTDGTTDKDPTGTTPTTTTAPSTTAVATTTTTPATTAPTTLPTVTAPPTAPPTTPPQPTDIGPWNLAAHYNLHWSTNTGTAGWNSPMDISSGHSASGTGSGNASVDGICIATGTGQTVATWNAQISFRVAITGQSDGQRFSLNASRISANLDSLTYSDETPPQVADCRRQAQAGYTSFVDGLLGNFGMSASSGATSRIGGSNTPGEVVITR
ncbi:MAG: hypothetical protein JWN46_3709 [Acidimicrobiales bacterium]|nr:hypothetical protein [Acidimicrobiales bacterium]